MSTTIKIRTRWNPDGEDAETFPCGVAGLAIHRTVASRGGLAISHIRSGLGIGFFLDADPEAVLAATQALGELTDWTQSGADIADEVTGQEVFDVISRWGGEMYSLRDVSDTREDIGNAP